VCVPTVGPRVNVLEAVPVLPVVTDAGVTEPPPAVTAKLTETPGTPLPNVSRAATTSGEASGDVACPVWLFPETTTKVRAARGLAVAVNEADEAPVAEAATVWDPEVVPRVQLVETRPSLPVAPEVALTVPLAKRVEQVTALEPSPTMMEELQANLARNHLENVTCLQAAWGESPLAPHDLVLVANVAPIFKDLLGFLTAAEPLACRAMAFVQNVGPGAEKFYLGELYPLLLGRPYPARDDYLRTLTLLHSLGIYANAQIIGYEFDQPFATMREATEFWVQQMELTEPAQRRKLVEFLENRLRPAGAQLIAPMRRQSAVIWWRVTPTGPA